MRIVMIEDNEGIINLIRVALETVWPEVELVTTNLGEEGIKLVSFQPPELVILDLGLPDISGFEVLKQLRTFSSVPIMILTVTNDEASIVMALSRGADDYMTKPFSSLELIARLKIMLKRTCLSDIELSPSRGSLHFGSSVQEFYVGDKYIKLTDYEGRIMNFLMYNPGRVISYRSISNKLWGEYYHSDCDKIKVYIKRLRDKIEDNPRNPKLILNKRGIGYYLVKIK